MSRYQSNVKAVTAVRQIVYQGIADFWLSLPGALVILVVSIPLTLRVYKRER